MADGFSLETTGLPELTKAFGQVSRELIRALTVQFNVILDDATARSIKNTPVLDGDLRKSIRKVGPRRTSTGIEGGVEASAPHAFEVHENPESKRYGKGPVSLRQPGTEEGGVGPKYITRVTDKHQDRWASELAQAAATVLQSIGPVTVSRQ